MLSPSSVSSEVLLSTVPPAGLPPGTLSFSAMAVQYALRNAQRMQRALRVEWEVSRSSEYRNPTIAAGDDGDRRGALGRLRYDRYGAEDTQVRHGNSGYSMPKVRSRL